MEIIENFIVMVVRGLNNLLWGDLFTVSIGKTQIGLSIMVLILLPVGIIFTIRTKFLPFRLFSEMIKVTLEPKASKEEKTISGLQALIVATATRVGMGNLAGVAAAVSFGGAGAVFWMWVVALFGAATSFIESTLAQIYKEKDPLYGGFRGGPSYYISRMRLMTEVRRDDVCIEKNLDESDIASTRYGTHYRQSCGFKIVAILFSISALICWAGISQIVANSVSQSFVNAFSIPPLKTTIALVIISAIIIFKKNTLVNILDKIVPIMACLYLLITIFIMIKNVGALPNMFVQIFEEAFGIRQVVSGGFGAVIMNGVKRGLFSNEAGSGSAPNAAAAADVSHPSKQGLIQAFGVFIDTLFICSCSAFIILLAPSDLTKGLMGMDLLQTAMNYHIGEIGVIFIAVILFLFSFSTFLGVMFYSRGILAFLFGDEWWAQHAYKLVGLLMLFFGGIAQYNWVWDLGDLGVALMTIFNMIAIIPLSSQAIASLKDYEEKIKNRK